MPQFNQHALEIKTMIKPEAVFRKLPPFHAKTGLVGTFRTDKAVRKTPSEQRVFALSLSAIVLEKFKQAVVFLELNFVFGHHHAPR